MAISAYWLQRQILRSLVMFLAIPLVAQPRQALTGQREGVSSQQAQPETAPNRPAAETTPTTPGDAASPAGKPNQHSPQAAAEQQQSGSPEPVGTAVAPYEKPLGVAASRPAGAVIAPAKQRRTRSILIRVGLLVGGAAAIGTVIALSKASPSRPN
ncbi:MAG TPA: hypothetical protein VFE27_18085 [Acidobacteriaceae bacterium]|jgi:hypothetical protein|nr:hypothetical protein [Acidobacteriaceae bacterium]